jgi:DNA-directed RNA polymerase specialized sigma subunit
MNKEDLQELFHIRKRKAVIERKIMQLESRLERCTGSYRDVVVQEQRSNQSRQDELIPLLDEVKGDYWDCCLIEIDEKMKIFKVIKTLSPRDFRIMWLRYIDCMTWSEVADEMNYCTTQIHRLHREILKKIEPVKV